MNFFRADAHSCARTHHLPSSSTVPPSSCSESAPAFIVCPTRLAVPSMMERELDRDSAEEVRFAFPCKRARRGSYTPNQTEEGSSLKTEIFNPYVGCPMTSESAGCSWVTWKPREPWYTQSWPCSRDTGDEKEGASKSVCKLRVKWNSLKTYDRLVLRPNAEDVSSLRNGKRWMTQTRRTMMR